MTRKPRCSLLPILLLLSIGMVACSSGGGDSEDGEYYVKINLNGTAYNLYKSADEYGNFATGYYDSAETETVVGATRDGGPAATEPERYCMFYLTTQAPGALTISNFTTDGRFCVSSSGLNYYNMVTVTSGTLTEYGGIGGTISGTVTGTASNDGGTTSVPITVEFHVKHIPEPVL